MRIIKHFLLLFVLAIIYILLFPLFAYSLDSCSLSMVDSWRDKFPFAIIFGSVSSTSYFNSCPEFVIFGETFKACSISTVAKLVKDIFVIRIAIGALINL